MARLPRSLPSRDLGHNWLLPHHKPTIIFNVSTAQPGNAPHNTTREFYFQINNTSVFTFQVTIGLEYKSHLISMATLPVIVRVVLPQTPVHGGLQFTRGVVTFAGLLLGRLEFLLLPLDALLVAENPAAQLVQNSVGRRDTTAHYQTQQRYINGINNNHTNAAHIHLFILWLIKHNDKHM